MSINSSKRLSAASKKLTAGADERRAYSIIKDAITSDNFYEYSLFVQMFVVLGHKDLLIKFIIKLLDEYKITQDLKDLVSEEGLSRVDEGTLVDLAVLRKERKNQKYDRFLNATVDNIINNIVDDTSGVSDDVLKYLTKVCC